MRDPRVFGSVKVLLIKIIMSRNTYMNGKQNLFLFRLKKSVIISSTASIRVVVLYACAFMLRATW